MFNTQQHKTGVDGLVRASCQVSQNTKALYNAIHFTTTQTSTTQIPQQPQHLPASDFNNVLHTTGTNFHSQCLTMITSATSLHLTTFNSQSHQLSLSSITLNTNVHFQPQHSTTAFNNVQFSVTATPSIQL